MEEPKKMEAIPSNFKFFIVELHLHTFLCRLQPPEVDFACSPGLTKKFFKYSINRENLSFNTVVVQKSRLNDMDSRKFEFENFLRQNKGQTKNGLNFHFS